jgi:putative flippase GtrA
MDADFSHDRLVFLLSSLLGLGVNIAVMNMMLQTIVLPYKIIAQGCGILAGMVINFAISKTFVFRKKEKENEKIT